MGLSIFYTANGAHMSYSTHTRGGTHELEAIYSNEISSTEISPPRPRRAAPSRRNSSSRPAVRASWRTRRRSQRRSSARRRRGQRPSSGRPTSARREGPPLRGRRPGQRRSSGRPAGACGPWRASTSWPAARLTVELW
jgi:hypothetical protein